MNEDDMFEFDEELAKKISDYFTGPYRREVTVVCEGCGKIGTMIEEMPAGCMRLGIPHGFCAECLRKMTNKE